MSEEIVQAGSTGMTAAETAATAALMGAIGGNSSKFLQRLQFMTASAKLCKKDEFPSNHFAAISGSTAEDHLDLGISVDIHIYAIRSKAVDLTSEAEVQCIFDMALDDKGSPTGLFMEIIERSEDKIDGNMYGPEFLVYEASTKKWMTFFCSNATLRNESSKFVARVGDNATLIKQFIDTGSFQYNSAKCIDCTTAFELPAPDEVAREVEKFKTEKPKLIEKADEAAQAATSRAQ